MLSTFPRIILLMFYFFSISTIFHFSFTLAAKHSIPASCLDYIACKLITLSFQRQIFSSCITSPFQNNLTLLIRELNTIFDSIAEPQQVCKDKISNVGGGAGELSLTLLLLH